MTQLPIIDATPETHSAVESTDGFSRGRYAFVMVKANAIQFLSNRNSPIMTARRIVNYMTAEPFRPFRINMASGKCYDIRHPEMVAVGRTTIHVFTWMNDEEDEAKEREQELSIILIESVEPLESATMSDRSEN